MYHTAHRRTYYHGSYSLQYYSITGTILALKHANNHIIDSHADLNFFNNLTKIFGKN